MVAELVSGILLVRPRPKASLDTWTYRAALIAGAILLAPPTAWLLSEHPLWRLGYRGTSALTASMLIGLSLTWWARIYLGRVWSGVATRKEDHKLIDTGPYALHSSPNLYRACHRITCDSGCRGHGPSCSAQFL